MRKRILSIMLVLIMIVGIISVVPVTANAYSIPSESAFVSKISSLQSIFKNGEYWNKYSSSDYSKTGSIPCKGKGNTTGVACTTRGYCGDSNGKGCTCTCGAYVEGGSERAWQCDGFAKKMAYECFGATFYSSSSWSKTYSLGTVYAGDLIRINNNSHTIFIYKVSGNTLYYADCNRTGPCRVSWGNTISYSELQSKFSYKQHLSGNTLTGNGTHTHSYDTKTYYLAKHPHYQCYICSCGDVKESTDEPVGLDTCETCLSSYKNVLSTDKSAYIKGDKVTVRWNKIYGATHYNLWLYKDNQTSYTKRDDLLKSTEFSYTDLDVGEYRTMFQTYNNRSWMSDKSDWFHVGADRITFKVLDKLGKAEIKLDKSEYKAGENVNLTWDEVHGATHYNIWLYRADENGEFKKYCSRNDQIKDLSFTFENVSEGDYYVYFRTYNSYQYVTIDGWRDWMYTISDPIYFSVKGDIKTGDVDGDGNVTIVDTTTIQRHLAKLIELSDNQLSLADTDADGKVTIVDATTIQRYLAKLINKLG